jgi:hypothetical protein
MKSSHLKEILMEKLLRILLASAFTLAAIKEKALFSRITSQIKIISKVKTQIIYKDHTISGKAALKKFKDTLE